MNAQENMHPFDLATKLISESGVYRGNTSEAYDNMVGPFGGFIAATLLRAVLEHPERIGEPLALTINYAAPIANGEFFIKANPARTNRSTQHWLLELFQGEETIITGTAVTAKRRETWSDTEVKFPSVPDPEKVPSIPLEGSPKWVRSYDIRVVKGFPHIASENLKENDDSETIQWVQDHPKRTLDFLSLTAMSDAFFPRVFVRRNKILPASTVSLTIYFHEDDETLTSLGADPILGVTRGLRFNRGFFDHTGEMWSKNGILLASTTQVVYYKD